MVTFYDVYSILLLIVSAGVFLYRFIREEPPVLPYLVISVTAGVSQWLSMAGAKTGALCFLLAASFLLLGCFFRPAWRSMSDESAAE